MNVYNLYPQLKIEIFAYFTLMFVYMVQPTYDIEDIDQTLNHELREKHQLQLD